MEEKLQDKPWYEIANMNALYALAKIKSDQDVADYFNNLGYSVSRRAITDARNFLGLPAKSKGAFFEVEADQFDDARSNREKLWGLVIEMQQELRKETNAKKDIHINIPDEEPIAVAFMGDLHIGDIGTDHKALLRDVDLIQRTERLFATMGGDYINNFIKGGKKIKNHEVVPVEFAWKLTEDLFECLKDSLLAIMLGNHDDWTDQAAEFDKLGEMVEKLGLPYGKHGANVHIHFPEQDYKIRLRHKYRFESSMNLLNAVKQMYRWDEPFDIGILHHLHTPAIEMFMQPPTGQCWAVRPGSYKQEDDYSYALGYSQNGFGMSRKFGTQESCKFSIPTAILWPNERRIVMVPTIQEAVDYLDFAREKYTNE